MALLVNFSSQIVKPKQLMQHQQYWYISRRWKDFPFSHCYFTVTLLLPLLIFVEHNSLMVINVFAIWKSTPQCESNGSTVLQIIVSNHTLDGLSGLSSVVKRDFRKHMMAHMCVCDMVEAVVKERTKRAIHSAECTSQPAPLLRNVHDEKKVSKLSWVSSFKPTKPTESSKWGM